MKRKKYLWVKKTDVFESMMNNREVMGNLIGCNWHECEYSIDDNDNPDWVRVTIDWDETGERNVTIKDEDK